jgi:hypothetical protein
VLKMGKINYREKRDTFGNRKFEAYDQDEENRTLGDAIEWLMIFVVPIVLNALISYVISGGNFSDFKNDTWVRYIKLHYQSFIIYFTIITLASTLISSFVSDFVDNLFPKISWAIGATITWFVVDGNFDVFTKIKTIGDTGSLITGIITIVLTIVALYVGGSIAYRFIHGYQTLGYWIRGKLKKFRG